MTQVASEAVLAVMGPTAAGKTALAVALARAVGGELINADSRQAIAELRIGVCKPTPGELGGVPCHGLDWRRLGEPFTVAEFVALASRQLAQCREREQAPILVGGTGLYVRALLEGFDFGVAGEPLPSPRDPGGEDLAQALAELERLSPAKYLEVDRRNPRRVFRALALARSGVAAAKVRPGWRALRLGCMVPPEVLRGRISRRSDQLVGAALRQEVEALLDAGFPPSTIAEAAIGYREALAWIQGAVSREGAVAQVAQRTWRYARSQMTWLRKEPDLVWIDGTADLGKMLESALQLVERRFTKEAI